MPPVGATCEDAKQIARGHSGEVRGFRLSPRSYNRHAHRQHSGRRCRAVCGRNKPASHCRANVETLRHSVSVARSCQWLPHRTDTSRPRCLSQLLRDSVPGGRYRRGVRCADAIMLPYPLENSVGVSAFSSQSRYQHRFRVSANLVP